MVGSGKSGTKAPCVQAQPAPEIAPGFVSPEATPRGPVRPSRMSRRRALVLVLLHLAIFAHLAHWLASGRTLSPLEPSEAMYTLRDGILNAGAILLLLSVLSTLVLGRFFCGWGCHVVALQDLCAWLLKKVGIHPRPLRSRWLVLVPLLAGLYMFFWPSLMGLLNGIPPPKVTNGLLKTEFWETFPGFWIGAITFFVCGFAIVYLLGAKGFCTYACPYGGLFGVVDRLAAGRIRVTDACKQCGHCTAVCTSNVLVSREVLEYGMVVDPGCMKCQDCVSVCPEGALYFGFGRPALFSKARRKLKKVAAQFSWREEVALAIAFVGTLAIFRGFVEVQVGDRIHFLWARELYGQIPLLLGLGLAAITAFTLVLAFRVLDRPAVDLFGLAMKTDGRLRRPGKAFLALTAAWIAFLAHSAVVQALTWRGLDLAERDEPMKVAVWWQRRDVLDRFPADVRARWDAADAALLAADRAGLVPDVRIPRERSWLAMARGRLDDAAALLVEAVRRKPDAIATHRDLAHVHMLRADPKAALAAIAEAERVHPDDLQTRRLRVDALYQSGDLPAAIAEQRVIVLRDPSPRTRVRLASLLVENGETEAGIAELRAVVAGHPNEAGAHATLAVALQQAGRMEEALPHFERAEALQPGIFSSLEPPR
jgi:tetratricopeptide (TPR) repeat protein